MCGQKTSFLRVLGTSVADEHHSVLDLVVSSESGLVHHVLDEELGVLGQALQVGIDVAEMVQDESVLSISDGSVTSFLPVDSLVVFRIQNGPLVSEDEIVHDVIGIEILVVPYHSELGSIHLLLDSHIAVEKLSNFFRCG